jgi:hypothetical protein
VNLRAARPIHALCLVLAAVALGCGDESSEPTPNTGRLTVTVTGLPGGVDADVQVDGPGNYAQLVTSTQTFAQLAPGAYVVTARPVTDNGTTYQPLPTTQSIAVASDQQAAATVTYLP